MIPINRTYAPIQAFVDELARSGLEHAVTCPGSRNAPLLLTLAEEPRLRCWSSIDERSAGFFALGIAKATRRPVAITCTSGTAAANLLPAVVEAREARVPLIVLTADRPPELREVGTGQSIDQLKLYGTAAKWFVEVGNHEPGRETAVHHRALACRAYATARGERPGPVHLNFPLREPLAPVREALDPEPWQGRSAGRPWVSVSHAPPAPESELVAGLVDGVAAAPRGAIVCGATDEEIAVPAARLAAAAGWPLLAEPTSGARCGPHDRSHVVAHYDALLRSPSFASSYRPELVLRLGDTPTSKPLRAWLGMARQVVVDPHAAWHEPTRGAEAVVAAGAASTCQALAEALESREGGTERCDAGTRDPGADASARIEPAPSSSRWVAGWREADALVPLALAQAPDPFEPKVYAAVADALPQGSTVWLASSMPVRDAETFFPQSPTSLRFLANRGANGIDGVVSSALGAAAASEGRTFLLTGDLSLLHDLGGLLAASRHGIELTIVCMNNGGGNIFDFLPVAAHAEPNTYEEHIATPSGVDFARVAALCELPHSLARTPEELRSAVSNPGLVEVPTDRARNVELHNQVLGRVAERLREPAHLR